ncbi:uncharacterized protein LOC129732312 isoform X1 [Wyeomyia smithii]|uniref:uncharacterized protein LOC129732312 isoform X1 n=1 Tax=Wyeomyia smithii TaxID=174621 RepID=UPI002467D82F|nr:uncharacterized protein LOC129732312 isoform X1 [Wyeomyia smithii]
MRSKMKLLLLLKLVSVIGLTATTVRAERCTEHTRPHATRCDQYFRCVLLPSATPVWVPRQCEKGLIYDPQIKNCVVPGEDWECNLSAEVGDESGENVYGINNLPAAMYTGPPVLPTTVPPTPEKVSEGGPTKGSNHPAASGEKEGYYIILDRDGNNRTTIYRTSEPYRDDDGEEEFSGDGQMVEMELTTVKSTPIANRKHSLPTSDESSEPSANLLNSFLAEYTYKTSSDAPVKAKRKHPLPSDGKIHPEHLMSIIAQQKKLNKYATQIKQEGDPTGGFGDKSPFADQPVFTSRPDGSVLFNVPQRVPEETHAKAPLMSEDVIRSIIEISKQMMTSHKPQMEEMYVKPIFIPVTVSAPTPDYTRLPDKLSTNTVMYQQLFPSLSNSTTQFSSKPIGITITNPYTLGQATIYDNLRDQVINDSKYYNYQATLMDAYGNQYQTQQPLPNIQMYAYPPTMTYPMPNYQPSYQYPGNAFYNQAELNNRLRNSLGYEGEDSMSNEVALSDEEEADNSAELPETVATVNDNSNEKNEESDEQAEMKKLISVGGVTLNYNDYKDSILPLLDANPDEVRISVLTCTLGSRQPNKTDCTKYYVCNPHNGAFQSFTCPSFTAFNAETRICDTITYKSCQAIRLAGSATQQSSSSNRITTSSKHKHQPTTEASLKLKQELMTAQKYVDLIKKEAIKILSRNKVTTESGPDSNEVPQGIITNPTKSSSIGFTNPNTLLITNPTMSSFMPSITAPYIPPTMMVTTTTANNKRRRTKPKRKPTSYKKRTKGTGKTTSGRTTASTTTTTTTPKPVPKAPKCKRNGKMPDPAERRNYYVCYKASPKKFIKTRMACPGKLFYCPSTEYCTYEKECKNN